MSIHPHGRRSKRRTWISAVIAAVVILGMLWVWNSLQVAGRTGNTSATTGTEAMVRTNEGGQVTIKVTWQGKSAGPVFTIEMDTHAVDLDRYNLQQIAALRTDQGQEIQPNGWDAPTGGHHRTGTLTFPATTTSGTPVIGPNTRTLELVIRNVSGIPERSFRWTL